MMHLMLDVDGWSWRGRVRGSSSGVLGPAGDRALAGLVGYHGARLQFGKHLVQETAAGHACVLLSSLQACMGAT